LSSWLVQATKSVEPTVEEQNKYVNKNAWNIAWHPQSKISGEIRAALNFGFLRYAPTNCICFPRMFLLKQKIR